jgi:entericidin B
MRKLISSVALLVILAGCNTMQGLGKDVKAGGEALEKASKK